MQTENTISQLVGEKKSLVQLSLVAVVLAISIGITASLVASRLQFWTVWIFVAISLLCILALARGLTKRMSFDEDFEATIFFQPSTKQLVEVRGYEFSKEISRTLQAVEAENRSIFSDWTKDPLVPERRSHQTGVDEKDESSEKDRKDGKSYVAISRINVEDDVPDLRPKSAHLLEEIIQFCMLDALSTHLSGHFNNSENASIQELHRKDIPGLLQTNRVLNLLTTPIEQRDIFLEAFPDAENRPVGEIHGVWCSDGAIYSKFDLTLPKGSKASALDSQTIRIETSRLIFDMKASYSGMSAVVPRVFESKYVRIDPDDLETRTVKVELKGRVKPLALLSAKGWEDYTWLDSFRAEIKSEWVFEEFMKRIGWESLSAYIYCNRKSTPRQSHT